MTSYPLRLCGEGTIPVSACAVVLVRGSEAQFHLGLGRRDAEHEPVLHLAWHRILLDEALTKVVQEKPAAVVTLSLDHAINETLQVLVRRVARRYANRRGGIPYGFGEVAAVFNEATGALTDADAAFTCATFVLAMLRSVGVQMIDSARWRAPTEEDLRWQREIGEKLLEWIEKYVHGDLMRARERVEHDIGSRRYRPTDVAGAALFGPATWPVGVVEVEPKRQMLESMLRWPDPLG